MSSMVASSQKLKQLANGPYVSTANNATDACCGRTARAAVRRKASSTHILEVGAYSKLQINCYMFLAALHMPSITNKSSPFSVLFSPSNPGHSNNNQCVQYRKLAFRAVKFYDVKTTGVKLSLTAKIVLG